MSEFEKELTDGFAMFAMQELLRDDLAKPIEKQSGIAWACKTSYIIAEEMIKARNAYYATKTA